MWTWYSFITTLGYSWHEEPRVGCKRRWKVPGDLPVPVLASGWMDWSSNWWSSSYSLWPIGLHPLLVEEWVLGSVSWEGLRQVSESIIGNDYIFNFKTVIVLKHGFATTTIRDVLIRTSKHFYLNAKLNNL